MYVRVSSGGDGFSDGDVGGALFSCPAGMPVGRSNRAECQCWWLGANSSNKRKNFDPCVLVSMFLEDFLFLSFVKRVMD